jgi:hypothetical protein
MENSNWVTFAWDENGKPCEGKIEVEGTVVDTYENQLFVQDEKAWKENSGYGRYTIMDISEGQLRYNRFKIIVARGSNDELFFVVEYNGSFHTENEDDKKQLIGFSCCIPGGEDRVRVIEDVKEEFFYWIKESKEDWWYGISLYLERIKDFEMLNQEEELVAKEPIIEIKVDGGWHRTDKDLK